MQAMLLRRLGLPKQVMTLWSLEEFEFADSQFNSSLAKFESLKHSEMLILIFLRDWDHKAIISKSL